ncbi:putative Histone-lysine N-methyltransferase ATXR5 [Trifolium repens]|nr:putative Histone-lysine N-methyltransferase ATXR5 [Trifolium repens]
MMTLLLTDGVVSLVIFADNRANIARFISGINNYTMEGKKKQNCKCVRYSVDGESRVFLVATRDIFKGDKL